MAIEDDINRELREFRRFTGDGLPGSPTGAPLPIGDPSSGPHSPKKSGLRALLQSMLSAVSIYVDQAQGWAEAAEQIALPDGSITAEKLSDDPAELVAIRDKIGAGEGGGSTSTGGNLSLALALSEAKGTYFAGGDLFADGFVSLGMVNVTGATGLDTSEAGFLKPTSSGETYSTTADPSLTGNAAANSQSSNTNRFRIPASVISVSGDRVRVTFKAATSGPLNILQAYVGHAGTGSDFDGTQVQLTFSGATSVNLAAGASLESDPVSYSLDETKDLMVSLAHGTSSTNAFNTGQAGYNFYSKAGVSDASATITTGYTPDPNSIACVDLVRVRTSPGVTANLNVASETIPALTPINVVSGELRVVPTTALTLNIDLFMDISRNAGGAWTPVDLQLFFQDGGTSVLRFGETDLSGAPAGAALRYRIRSANNKAFKAAGVALGISA